MKINIKLGFRSIKDSDAVIKGGQYADGVVDNPYFTTANILAQGVKVRTASSNLKLALEKPKGPTRTSDIKAAREAWEKEVKVLASLIEIEVNDAPGTKAEKIAKVQSANMEVVGHSSSKKHTFSVKRGDNSGEVDCDAEGDDAVAHLYTWTSDLENFTNKADPWETAGAKTTALGVPKGNLAFFHKGIFYKKRMDWEGPILLTVL